MDNLDNVTLRDVNIALARQNFYEFCKLTDSEGYTEVRPHAKILCDTLQAFYEGELLKEDGDPYTKLMIRLPPQHLKSRTLVNFTKWVFGQNQKERIITGSYGDSPATDFSRYTRDGIREVRNTPDQYVFSDVFPNVRVKKTDASVQKWSLEGEHFSYLGVGCGGAVTGKGATLRLADDLVKDAEEAMNDAALEKIWRWFSGTFSSRTSAKGGEIKEIVCGTLWGEGDPQMILQDTEGDEWYILSMPIYDDEKDEMLCDDLMSKKKFLELKKRMFVDSRTKMIFYANYMCEAISDNESKCFPRSTLKTYKEIPKITVNENGVDVVRDQGRVIAFADTADEGMDYFAMPIARVIGNSVYLFDCIFDQHDLTIQEGQVSAKVKQHKIRKIVIETNNAGAYFRRRLIELNRSLETYGQWSKANKMSRILSMAGIIKLHFYFPENPSPVMRQFMNQVYKLKKTARKEDDAADSLAGLAHHLELIYNIFA